MSATDIVLILTVAGGLLTGLKVLIDSIRERRSARYTDAHVMTEIATDLVRELKSERDQYKQELDNCCDELDALKRTRRDS